MYFFTLSPKQAGILLPFVLSLPINALSIDHQRRATSCDGDDEGNEAPTLDGPTSDKSPGIGVEFETGSIIFTSTVKNGCSKENTDASKGQLVNNRRGTNWKLTADTLGEENVLDAEYILDGGQIKIGAGTAAVAAAAVADDLTSWDPSAAMKDPSINVDGSKCNPWKITQPEKGGGAADISWAPQVTVPLPLEAISDLFSKIVTGWDSSDKAAPLLPRQNPGGRMVYVTKDFFQSSPNGISSNSVKDDVLGFFSLVISYAKSARTEDDDKSPKELTTIMPRTDFTTVFKQVKSAVPGTLYDVVKVLACYKNNGKDVELDSNFCDGTIQAPKPNGKMDRQKFQVSSNGKTESCTVQEWMQTVQDGKSPDRLSEIDQVIDGSIGGFKDALENVLNTNRAVPLFEFRRLPGVKAGDMKDRIDKAEQAVISYHKADTKPPARFIRKRLDTKFSNIK